MDISTIQNCCGGKKGIIMAALGITLILFLLSFVVSTAVDIKDKISGRGVAPINTITVSDSGEIYAKPDLGIVDVSVVTEAKTVTKAMNDNTTKSNAVIDFLKKLGIEDKDLKTTYFNISPRYEWYQETVCRIPPCPSGKRTLVGYEVTQQMEVKIRDLAKAGDIIQGATVAGANQVGDLQFTIDKPDEFQKKAREEAIAKAKAKAQELSKQLGVKLVKITSFNEGGVVPMVPSAYLAKEAVGLGGGETAPSIQTGENKITVNVIITYEIQ